MTFSSLQAQSESEIRLARQLCDVEVAKYKAVAENASKSALDYTSLHGYESWMKALKSAQEEARLAKANEIEANKQVGYVIEELKRMTMYKERAELETKQIMLRYGGLSMKQLIYPIDINTDEAEKLLENPIGAFKKEDKANSSSFFSSFRRKLTEKFSSFSSKQEDAELPDATAAPNQRVQPIGKQAPVPSATTRNSYESPPILSTGQSKLSPPKLSTQQGSKSMAPLPQSQSPPVNRRSTISSSSVGNDDAHMLATVAGFHKQQFVSPKPREQDTSAKKLSNSPSLMDHKLAAARNPLSNQHSLKDDASDQSHSSRTSAGGSLPSRPSTADAGLSQSAKEVHEDRLPAQYQIFRARQSNLAVIPKLAFATPRQLDSSVPRYHMRRDVTITDPTQCAWLQKAAGPLIERYILT